MDEWFETDEFWDGFLLLPEDEEEQHFVPTFELIDWECQNCGHYNQNFDSDFEWICFNCGLIMYGGDYD